MDVIYQYPEASSLEQMDDYGRLFLAHFNEQYTEQVMPCFFYGELKDPYLVARSFLALSKVAAANFMPMGSALRDPVITAGAGKIRLEAFSSCCSVYAKVDLLPSALEGDFLQQGTTNVDFNTDMITALSQIKKHDQVFFSIGKKEVILKKSQDKIVEKKVALPIRWIKGMATVQVLASEMSATTVLNPMQMQLLFRSLPKGVVNDDYYLTLRGNRPSLSPLPSPQGICIGGIHRLRLLEGLLTLAESLTIYTLPSNNATAFELSLKEMRFTLMLSRNFWRGFSGEGSALSYLIEDIPEAWIERLDNYAKIHPEFGWQDLEQQSVFAQDFKNTAIHMASMGLLGFDLAEQVYYYRKLPFKMSRIESLNPRYKNALKIIEKGDYQWLDSPNTLLVQGSGHSHTVMLDKGVGRCTCTWYASHQNTRGECKHILVAKILKTKDQSEISQLLEELER